jgi:4-hydroxy-3-polyprenylbenzoate decarboxylase
VFSENGARVWKYELDEDPRVPPSFKRFENSDLFAAPASGSAGYTHMIICPCSMATLARIANGISTDLIARAADVMLKERRRLILVIREMPYSLVHIRNMETITLAGGIICPASPAFYTLPKDIGEAVNSVTEKIISVAGFDAPMYRWGQE